MGTTGNEKQLQINFEPGLTQRFPTQKSLIAYVVHTFGLVRMANALNISHGELSKLLTDERNLDVNLADRIADIANTDMIADWQIERRKAQRPEVSKADVLKRMDELSRQFADLAASIK